MLKIEELKRICKEQFRDEFCTRPQADMAKITLAAIEDAQSYQKDENGLLPCPFCGTSEKLVVDSLGDNDWFVECEGCRMSLHAYHNSAESAEKHWNTRANTAAVRAVLEVTGGG